MERRLRAVPPSPSSTELSIWVTTWTLPSESSNRESWMYLIEYKKDIWCFVVLKGFNDASFDGNEGKGFPFFCNQSCKIWFARSGRVPPQNRGHSQPHWWKHFIGHSFEDLCLGIPMIALLQPTIARGKLWWNQK